MNESKAVELYRKYRPTKFSEVVGQPEAIEQLNAMGKSGKIPGFILLTGPSGTGKTSIARILKNKLKVSDLAFTEINAAENRGIDLTRDIKRQLPYPPLEGNYKMWLIDEAHQATGECQSSFLKMLEDIPSHVKYIFCTTDPQKLKPTIRTRATTINLKAVSDADLEKLVKSVAEKENTELEEEVLDKLVRLSDGSPRKALVFLGQIIGVKDDNRLEALDRSDPSKDAIEIARGLLNGDSWAKLAKVLKSIDGLDEQAESIRWLVLSYMKSVAIKSPAKASRACEVIYHFRDNFFDSKGAGLVQACYDCTGK